MRLYVLDTDHVTLFQRAHPAVVQRVTAMDYFNSVYLLDFDQTAYTRYEELRRQRIHAGT